MKLGYADSPYFGCCGKFYDHYHGDGTYPFDGLCWDDIDTHRVLIDHLTDEFPDGWALSCTTSSLLKLGPYFPDDVRIGAWVKSFAAFKKGVRPAYAWEPVVYRGGHNPPWEAHPPPLKGGKQTTPKDFFVTELDDLASWEVFVCPITMKKGLTGAKPELVCDWILDLLGVREGDEFVDIFTGTGVMGERAALRTSALAVVARDGTA